MKVRYCPKCGKYNREDAWNCISCGETLSVDTITEIDSGTLSPKILEELQKDLPKEQPASPSKDGAGKMRVFICPRCGKYNPVFNRTCQECGEDLSHTTFTEVDDSKIEETQAGRAIEPNPVQQVEKEVIKKTEVKRQKWEYLVVGLNWERKIESWVVFSINGRSATHESVYTFMNRKGEEGWELVSTHYSVQNLVTEGTSFYQSTKQSDTVYRLFFKRTKE